MHPLHYKVAHTCFKIKIDIYPLKQYHYLKYQIRSVTDMQEFITPPNHKGFSAKRLFEEMVKLNGAQSPILKKAVAARREIIHIAITISLS